MASIPAEIRAEMGRQNVSLKVLSEKTGIDSSTLSRRINKEKADLSVNHIEKIAAALELPVWELMRRADEAKEKTAA